VTARRTARPLILTVAALGVGVPAVVLAQEVGPYEPLGIRAGSFLIFPSLNVSEVYDDNVFATDNDTDDDLITVISPQVRVESNFSRHRLGLTAGSEVAFHVSETDEDYQDFFVSSDGRLDITRQNFVDAEVLLARQHQSRDDPEDTGDRNQLTEFNRYGGELSFTQLFNRFNFRVTGRTFRTAYEESDQSDRDQNAYEGLLRAGFFVSPRINAFVQGSYNIQKRDRRRDFSGIDRDSDGWGVSVGTAVDLTNLLVGEASIGYRRQSFDQDGFSDEDGIGYGLDLTWTPTLLTTVVLSGGGNFVPTSSEGSDAKSNFQSSAGVNVNHELLRNVRLNGSFNYVRDDFSDISRTDNTIYVGGGASYLLNRYLSVDAGYTFSKRWSDDNTEEFDRNVVRVGVTGRL
jgi:hypothetical protein